MFTPAGAPGACPRVCATQRHLLHSSAQHTPAHQQISTRACCTLSPLAYALAAACSRHSCIVDPQAAQQGGSAELSYAERLAAPPPRRPPL
mmetsp:Transcript_29060/g.86029  ORF Transcript_29060/g.86029 Transcript_29060/m.86029 type:complete len:91 (-) Transcript_29060:380-652(-)